MIVWAALYQRVKGLTTTPLLWGEKKFEIHLILFLKNSDKSDDSICGWQESLSREKQSDIFFELFTSNNNYWPRHSLQISWSSIYLLHLHKLAVVQLWIVRLTISWKKVFVGRLWSPQRSHVFVLPFEK